MIAYRIDLWCDGCTAEFNSRNVCFVFEDAPRNLEYLLKIAQIQGWVADGAYHFCPNCQIQRQGVANQSDAGKTLQQLKSKIVQ